MTGRKIRRFRQELPENEVIRILNVGKVAILAVEGDEGYPYAVPVNFVYSDNCIYIHCARQGHKTDALKRNPNCSVCIIDKDDVVPEEFTSYFRSVIAFGKAETVSSEDDIIRALILLCEKYSPGLNPSDEIRKCLKTVCVIRIHIEKVTGKEAIELVRCHQT